LVQEIFTVNELAERWKCTPLTVYRMVESGKLKCFRIGQGIRIPQAEVERYERGEQ